MRIVVLLAALAMATPAAALPGCDAFLQRLKAEGADIGLDYSRALVVSRAHTNAVTYDITTQSDVDGTLVCRGDQFQRFEAHVVEPLKGKAAEGFARLEQIGLKAALGWEPGRARSVTKGLEGEAREYLAASRERGDIYISGKTERHEPGSIGLGMIFSEVDRAFVIALEE